MTDRTHQGSANELLSRFADGVGSRFRRERIPLGSLLPENDSRPRSRWVSPHEIRPLRFCRSQGERTTRRTPGRRVAAALLLAFTLSIAFSACRQPEGGSLPPESPPMLAEPQAPGAELLRDVTPQSQIDFAYRNGEEADRYTILESVGGGIALLDYDGDGWLDMFIAGGGELSEQAGTEPRGLPGRLCRNLGDWRFADVTEEAGLSAAPFYSHGCLAGDFDNDGWPDLLVTGFGGMALYHNRPGEDRGRWFADVTQELGLADDRWCTGAAWGDLTGDGRMDLYVCRYLDWSVANDPVCTRAGDPGRRDVCPPQRFGPLPDSLFHFDGQKFIEVSERAGLSNGKGLGVILADIDGDGRPDLYVANDDGNNHLYVNRGGGKLEERGMIAGVAVDDRGRYNGSMGLDVGDFDGQGRCSLLVTNFQNELHALYANLGNGQFLHQSQAVGLGALGQGFVGFGTALVDLRNDGWLDLIIVNGHVLRYPVGTTFEQRPVLFQNVEHGGRRFFRDISPRGGPYFSVPALGRGLAIGDLDNDGWPDIVVSHCNRPVTLLRNVAFESEPAHWLGLELVGRGHRPVAGATIRVETGGRQLTRFATSGGKYLSTSDPRILVGLGDADRVDRVSVQWPWGELQTWSGGGLAIDRYWRLEEGVPEAR
jgi:enediyne biosynthesis protein E4